MAYTAVPATADTTEITADSTEVTVDRANVRTVEDYASLVTAFHRSKARFMATVRASVGPFADAQAVISTLPLSFDLDYAIGAQLDVVGEWVGLSRNVPVPLANAFFTFGSPTLGFGTGYWKGPYDSGQGISVLPDDLYRRLLRAKIAANSWDGTSDGILAILRAYFTDPSTRIIVDDAAPSAAPTLFFSFGDALRGWGTGSWHGPNFISAPSLGYGLKIGFAGKIPSQIDLAILDAKLIPIKAMGAHVETFVATVDQTPLFGFGADNASVGGFGRGSWGASPSAVAALNAA